MKSRIRVDHARVRVKMKPGRNEIRGLFSNEERGFGWGMILAVAKADAGREF